MTSIGLAVAHVAAGDEAVGAEIAGIVRLEAVEQGELAAARHHVDAKARLLHTSQHFGRAGHGRSLLALVEEGALAGIEFLHFAGRGGASPLALREHIDGGFARAPLVHIYLFGRQVEAIFAGHDGPRLRMIGHGVEEDAVHVKKDGFEA